MTDKLFGGVMRRVNRGKVRDLLEGKIHESFTKAADQLYQRGYLDREERIALSSLIGDVLPEFGEGVEPGVGNRTVDAEDLRAIAAMSTAGPLRRKHYGPGPHPGTGTPQSVHGSGGSSLSVSGAEMEQARKLGYEALAKGIKAPAMDPEMQRLIEGMAVGEGAADLMKEWHKGFTKANLESGEEEESDGGWWQDNPATEGYDWTPGPNQMTAGYKEARVNPAFLEMLPGARGEHRNIDWERVNELAESIKEEGLKTKPLIIVEQDGRVHIWEGNHRVRAANKAGLKDIVVEVRYFGGSEERPGVWKPRLVNRSGLIYGPMRRRHYGPGPHPGTGTPQDVHGAGGPAASESGTWKKTCPRCGGFGEISSYSHVQGGVCFECGGAGYVPETGELIESEVYPGLEEIRKRRAEQARQTEEWRKKQEARLRDREAGPPYLESGRIDVQPSMAFWQTVDRDRIIHDREIFSEEYGQWISNPEYRKPPSWMVIGIEKAFDKPTTIYSGQNEITDEQRANAEFVWEKAEVLMGNVEGDIGGTDVKGFPFRGAAIIQLQKEISKAYKANRDPNDFLQSLANQFWEKGYLTEGQANALLRNRSMETRGGPGSGHHGHRGIPGQRGGSLPRAAGTHLGGIGVPDFSDNSKKTYISQRYAQVDDQTVVALVYLRRMEVFKDKPYRMESRWYVRNRKDRATDAQIKVGESMLKELIDSTLTVMKATGWQKALRDSNLWLAPWGAGMLKEAKLVQRDGVVVRGGPGSGHFGHAGRPGEVGGSLPEGQGGRRARPTGGPARSRHPVGVTPVSELDEVDGARSEMLMSEPTERADDTVFGLAYTEAAWTDLAADIMDNYPPEIQQAMAEAEEKIRNGEQTINKYRDPETGEWQPERQRLHERIIEQIMSEAGETEGEGAPQIWITGGLPGAGKSTVLKERGEALPAGVHIDSDRIKTMIPEYEGWNAALVHEESSAIVQELFRRATNDGHNIIYDATLKTTSKAEALIQGFQDRGYEVNVVYVDIPMADAMERAVNRFVNEGGRYVSPMYIATHDSKNLKTLATLRNMVDYWEHWDNSQPLGQPPTMLASGGRRVIQ